MSNNVFNNIPYAPWLEKVLQELIKLPVKSICIHAITNNGEAYTNYYETSMLDKLTIAGLIQQDAMLDSLATNGIIEYADEEGETNGEEKE